VRLEVGRGGTKALGDPGWRCEDIRFGQAACERGGGRVGARAGGELEVDARHAVEGERRPGHVDRDDDRATESAEGAEAGHDADDLERPLAAGAQHGDVAAELVAILLRERLAHERPGLVRRREGPALDDVQVVNGRVARRLDAEDGDRIRGAAAGRAAQEGPVLDDRRDRPDALRLADRLKGRVGQAGIDERGHAQVGPARRCREPSDRRPHRAPR